MLIRPHVRRALVLVCLLCVFSAHALAGVDARLRVELEYTADAELGCPDAELVIATVNEQVGYEALLAASDAADHRVRTTIARADGAMEARIEWLDAQGVAEGERRLSSENSDCHELARGLSFAIAVQVQLLNSALSAAPPTSPSPPSKPAPKPPKRASPPAREKTSVRAGAGAVLQGGLTPRLSPGVRVHGAVSRGLLGLELGTHFVVPSELRLADGSGFEASTLGATLSPCVHASTAGVCLVFMFGQLSVRGQGVDQVRSPSSLVGGAGARLQLLWPRFEPWGALFHVEAIAPFTPRSVLLNGRKVWDTAPITLLGGVDLAAIFR